MSLGLSDTSARVTRDWYWHRNNEIVRMYPHLVEGAFTQVQCNLSLSCRNHAMVSHGFGVVWHAVLAKRGIVDGVGR